MAGRINTIGATPQNTWQDGVPANEVKATRGSGQWFTALQESVVQFIERQGVTPDLVGPNFRDLEDAIRLFSGNEIPSTTAALSRDLTDIPSFSTPCFLSSGDNGGASWRRTGVVTPGSAGTIDYPNGLLYDLVGNQFSYDSQEVTFEAFGKASGRPLQEAIDYQTLTGKPIRLMPATTYAIGGFSGLEFSAGACIRGPKPHDDDPAKMARFTYTGSENAIDVIGGAAPRESPILENFMIDAGVDGNALTFTNCNHAVARGIHASGGHLSRGAIQINGGVGNKIENCKVTKLCTINSYGIFDFGASGTEIISPLLVNSDDDTWAAIQIHSSTSNTHINGVSYIGTPASPPVVDSGVGTVYVDGKILASNLLDLDNATGTLPMIDGLWVGGGGYINRIWIEFVQPCTGTADVKIGKSEAAGTMVADFYATVAAITGANFYERTAVAAGSISDPSVPADAIVMVTVDAGTATGTCRAFVEVLPYRGIH